MKILIIARYQLLETIKDARFFFMASLVLTAFILNGVYFSHYLALAEQNYNTISELNRTALEKDAHKLDVLIGTEQLLLKQPSKLSFIATDGAIPLPNAIEVNSVKVDLAWRTGPVNTFAQTIPRMDWSFIIGTLLTLQVIIFSYNVVCGEKRSGTLRQILSNSISRLELFIGKYLGSLSISLLILLVGILLSMLILSISDRLTFSAPTLIAGGASFVFATLLLSFFQLLSMAISSMTRSQTTSLIVLLIIWTLCTIAIPGISQLLSEEIQPVQSHTSFLKAFYAENNEAYKKVKDKAVYFSTGDNERSRRRAQLIEEVVAIQQKHYDNYSLSKIDQAISCQSLSQISPIHLMDYSLKKIVNNDIESMKDQREMAHRFKNQFLHFIKEKDQLDPDSLHIFIVYWIGAATFGTISTKPVEDLSGMPVWESISPNSQGEIPMLQLLILIGLNFQVAIIAFIALYRYDPR